MKKILVIIFSLLISCLGYSQVTGYGYTMKLGPASNQVSLYVMPRGSGKVLWTQIEFAVGFKISDGVPTGTWATDSVLNSMFGREYAPVIDNAGSNGVPSVSVNPAGFSYHAYSINLAPGVFQTADVTSGTEYRIGTITYKVPGGKTFTPYLLDFADFGNSGDGATYVGDIDNGPSFLYPGYFIPSDIPGSAYFYSVANGGYNNSGSLLVDIGAGNSALTPTMTLLPLKLLSFTAKQSNSASLLNWTVSEQQNTATFIVERSTDGVTYSKIGTVAAAGNYAGKQTYSFTDANTATGPNYYRLKMVDIDGKFTYSPVKTVNFDAAALSLQITPNPTQGVCYVKGLTQPAVIKLIDVNGRVLLVQNGVTSSSPISVTSLARAVYFVQVIQNGQVLSTLKLIKE
ncbi:T9SS type A sorting domain-containing protein [Pinibacter aurantiacus]|uniref:T9SS type A sorting domain-containing protein n=1 Tax=Pinibacter aurantiacus TaxID=2851599 RepID=A0A9E2W7T3_9BACT|nr:T9SS type A sorting domain-containing protein [Pinibacter aurantiacus]MBV4356837.1 T9SS type A sorting domain-containing protein [Pinibacter aurantiacus]